MAMLRHVRAEARRTAFKLNLANETTFHQRVEAIVNGRVGNLRHRAFGADENLLRRLMVALLHDHVINVLPLRRETKAARAQPFGQAVIQFFLDQIHCRGKINVNLKPVKI